jgi:hypothetical protein
MAKALSSVNDKVVDEYDFENDVKEEDVDDEDYKKQDKDEDDEDDVDDDDDKVIRLVSMNEKHFCQDDYSMVLISFDKDENDDELTKR